ncbi:hypothetical protein ACHWQZ_G015208 [Mnemiopsis leidyi]
MITVKRGEGKRGGADGGMDNCDNDNKRGRGKMRRSGRGRRGGGAIGGEEARRHWGEKEEKDQRLYGGQHRTLSLGSCVK